MSREITTDSTVLMIGSFHEQVGRLAAFTMPKTGPKRLMPMSERLFDELLHNPAQGHLATGIDYESLSLTERLTKELRQAIGNKGCRDIVGLVMPEELWDTVELQTEKLWYIPVALVIGNSDYKAVLPGKM